MSLALFGYKDLREKINCEKEWMKNDFSECPLQYDSEACWIKNAPICRLYLLESYCNAFGIYQILNKEFNDTLADEIKKLQLNPILEVGAGNGELAKVLRKRGIDVYAVDSFKDSLPERALNKTDLPEKLDYRDAIDKYKPELIICSWMPQGEDWTVYFRNIESVKAYILIGEIDGRCGTRESFKEIPGWANHVLKEPNKWSMCRTDYGLDFDKPEIWWRHSQIIIYKRQTS
ncbi:MAG: class I SAM-dependent methyltransferase [Clostridiales bacterium]|nr:class I SAM-dependent methyltransferase [Clostridiales bacterium]MCF8021642.1 class I SAM-dependent methyltransferase [Clostridiales bacterium]